MSTDLLPDADRIKMNIFSLKSKSFKNLDICPCVGILADFRRISTLLAVVRQSRASKLEISMCAARNNRIKKFTSCLNVACCNDAK